MIYDTEMLDAVFGPDSFGSDPETRARSSTRLFVRSQVQLGFDNEIAKGRRLSAREALELFGFPALTEVATKGRAHLFKSTSEPSATLRARREQMQLSKRTVARRACVSIEELVSAERRGTLNSIQVLERIAETLALDERFLTTEAGARGDAELGLQLRTLGDAESMDEGTAAILAEAAWVIARQKHLRDGIGSAATPLSRFDGRSDDYTYKTYEKGYRLAGLTRLMLGLGETEPIHSVRAVAEDLLGVPIVEAPLGPGLAGATVVNNKVRGIVLSSMLASGNKVLLRRATLAHELGHALWDPDDRLGRIKVDSEKSVGAPAVKEVDKVEMRARAFAIAFLAPTRAVRRIHREASDFAAAVHETIMHFGLSAPAAVFHLRNVCRLTEEPPQVRTPKAAHALWDQNERPAPTNLRLANIPLMRRGKFAELVVAAWRAGRISEDTASEWLREKVDRVSG